MRICVRITPSVSQKSIDVVVRIYSKVRAPFPRSHRSSPLLPPLSVSLIIIIVVVVVVVVVAVVVLTSSSSMFAAAKRRS